LPVDAETVGQHSIRLSDMLQFGQRHSHFEPREAVFDA